MRFTDRISIGDIQTKIRSIRRFLEDAHPVNLTCKTKKARKSSVIAADKAAEGIFSIFYTRFNVPANS